MVTFSKTVVITDLETYVNTEHTKQHDGLSEMSKKYEDLVWFSVNYQYNLLLDHIYKLYTDELEICYEKIVKLIKRIISKGKSPILEGGGGRNRILGPEFKTTIYNLIILLQSNIQFRKTTNLTITFN